MHRHVNVSFDTYLKKLTDPQLRVVEKMELTGGEPDLILIDGAYYVIDLSKETPKQRVSVCYDLEAKQSRKKFSPESDATTMAESIGITLLDENLYVKIQSIEEIDLKTSSWLLTPNEFRKKGGALFGDKRYGRAFIYHNGAHSYYSTRGFRGYIKLS
ncbi:MAG: DUF4256 domain-containing protein [Acholeplasma sp.]|nr:DUF4256 domain-containing protein [Acholeplasma sp.]